MKEEIFIALAIAGGLYLFAKTNDAAAAAAATPATNAGGGAGTGDQVLPAANNIAIAGTAAIDYQNGSVSLQGFL